MLIFSCCYSRLSPLSQRPFIRNFDRVVPFSIRGRHINLYIPILCTLDSAFLSFQRL